MTSIQIEERRRDWNKEFDLMKKHVIKTRMWFCNQFKLKLLSLAYRLLLIFY